MQKTQKRKDMIKKVHKDSKGFCYYIPLIFIIVIIPLITYGKIVELTPEEANFWRGGTVDVDFFNYYKSIFFVLSTIIAFVAFLGLYLNKKIQIKNEKKYYILMCIYLIMAIISTILSSNKQVSLFGFIGMYQGIFVLISYISIVFISMNYIENERDIRILMYSFAMITIVEGLLGVGQYFGYDFMQSPIGHGLITPQKLQNVNIKVVFEKYSIYGTMYNTNFVGSFGALILPITSILYLSEVDKKKLLIFGFSSLIAYATLLGSNSRAGYVGTFSTLIIGCILFRSVIKKSYMKTIVLSIGFIIITILFDFISGGKVLSQFLRLNPVLEARNINSVQEGQVIKFEEILSTDDGFKIKTNKETLNIYIENSKLSFKDENGEKIGIKADIDGQISFIDEKYKDYNFTVSKNNPRQIKAEMYGRKLNLYITDEQDIKIISINKKLTYPIKAPRIELFDGRETFASNRGYIWSRAIPMTKDTILIGYGPDNFLMVFPQEDYVGRFNVGTKGMLGIVVDKPHNMYLQTAINTGVISLLSLVAIWVMYLIDSFKIYIVGNMKCFAEYMGAAIFLSITAYLVTGIFNDSVISVAPMFWILLGTGIGINRMLKDKIF